MKTWKRFISAILTFAILVSIFSVCVYAEEVIEQPVCIPQTGLSSIYEYTTFDAGKAGTLYVNQYFRTPHVQREDLTLGGERLPVTIAFYYDPINVTDTAESELNPYGAGWLTTYNQLVTYDAETQQYAFKNSNGTWIYFEYASVNEDNIETWTESTTYGIGATGAVLNKSASASRTDYTSVDILNEDIHYTFDAQGRLTKISDGPNQNIITYVSDSSLYQIQKITDSVGRQFCFSYNNTGYLSSISCKASDNTAILVDSAPVAAHYSIANGKLMVVSFNDNNAIVYSYDSANRLTSLSGIDYCGYTVTYSEGEGRTSVSAVTAKAAMGTAKEETGTETTFVYENDSVLISDGNYQQLITFDECGRQSGCELRTRSTSLATRGTSAIAYRCLYGVNFTFGYVEQADGSVVNKIIDAQLYDADGVIETDDELLGEDPTENENYAETVDEYGNLLSMTSTVDGLHQTATYTYSGDGNYLLTSTDYNGNSVQYNYDTTTGILQSLVDGNGNTTEYTYDAVRELANVNLDVSSLTNGSSMAAQYSYDHGRIAEIDYGAYQYVFSYDIWGNVLSVAMNNQVLVSYNYGDYAFDGTVESLTYGNGKAVYYTYNDVGMVASVAYDDVSNIRFTYAYDSEGNLSQITDIASGQTTCYNDNGYMVSASDDSVLYSIASEEDSQNYVETINGVTLNTAISENEGTTKTVTDSSGNRIITSETNYDSLNRLTSKSTTAGTKSIAQSYSYYTGNTNEAGTSVKDYMISYASNGVLLNPPSTPLYNNTVSFHYTYDGNGNITSVKRTDATTRQSGITDPNPPVSTMSVAENDSLVSTLSGGTSNVSYTASYAYDEAGQLVSAVDEETGYTYRYTYDNSGNIQTMQLYTTDSDGTQTLVSGKTLHYTNGIFKGYTPAGGTRYTYVTDAMGNPTSIRQGRKIAASLAWGEGRSLTRYSTGSTTSSYTYNADGLRLSKTVTTGNTAKTTNFIWGENGLVGTVCGDDTVIVLYDSEGDPIGFSVNGTVYTYVKNLQGDVIRILNKDNVTVTSYTYDPWGVPTVSGSTALAKQNPCSYRGYYYDWESGYYYLQSRYYDPEIGRFLNADEIWTLWLPQGSVVQNNIFSYCQNNSPSSYDPTGFARISIILKVSFLRRWLGKGCGLIAKAIAIYIFKGIKWAGAIGFALGWIIGRALGAWLITKDLYFSLYIPFVSARTWTLY